MSQETDERSGLEEKKSSSSAEENIRNMKHLSPKTLNQQQNELEGKDVSSCSGQLRKYRSNESLREEDMAPAMRSTGDLRLKQSKSRSPTQENEKPFESSKSSKRGRGGEKKSFALKQVLQKQVAQSRQKNFGGAGSMPQSENFESGESQLSDSHQTAS